MPSPFRLVAIHDDAHVSFHIAFPAPAPEADGICAAAHLEVEEGAAIDAGLICAPTAITWREQRLQPLGRYELPGTGQARLRWGEAEAQAHWDGERAVDETVARLPQVLRFQVQQEDERPFAATVSLLLRGLEAGQRLRLDGGPGGAHLLQGDDGGEQAQQWALSFAKPGVYHISLDLLDGEDYYLGTLVDHVIELPDSPATAQPEGEGTEHPATPAPELAPQVNPADVPAPTALEQPWHPFRFGRPLSNWATTYTAPGGNRISRRLPYVTYLSIHEEAIAGGRTWYRTGSGDWIPANHVALFQPSEFKGVLLAEDAFPPQDPPPPDGGTRRGVVTAAALNVRAQPGVSAQNPPIDRLVQGTEITILEERTVAGDGRPEDVWYRIGAYHWVHSGWVRLLDTSTPEPEPEPEPEPDPEPGVRRGVVTATVLNVRAQPGLQAGNPPVARLNQGAEVTIYEQRQVAGAGRSETVWYRIAEARWVHGDWVQLREGDEPPGPPPEPEKKQGVVTASALNVRAQPGVSAGNPPIDRLLRGAEVSIYEERLADGAAWYRVGAERWVHSGWVRLQEIATAPMAPVASAAEGWRLPLAWVKSNEVNVRAHPGVSAGNPPITTLHRYDLVPVLASRQVEGQTWHRIGEERWVYGPALGVARFTPRPAAIGAQAKWVAVDLSEQTAVAYEGERPVFATMISSGVPGYNTVRGIFHTWWRLPWRRMTGGTPGQGGYYYLEDVTWTCYFYGGYALHTAYWHDDFGSPRSHGCVNLSPHDAWWIFQWSADRGERSPSVYIYR